VGTFAGKCLCGPLTNKQEETATHVNAAINTVTDGIVCCIMNMNPTFKVQVSIWKKVIVTVI
jgi:flagellar motor component MotA